MRRQLLQTYKEEISKNLCSQEIQTGLVSEAQNDRCGICGEEYEDKTPEEELRIECSTCMLWFHADCVGINPSQIPEVCHCCLSS